MSPPPLVQTLIWLGGILLIGTWFVIGINKTHIAVAAGPDKAIFVVDHSSGAVRFCTVDGCRKVPEKDF
jgi:hypothetical protein